MKLYVMAELLLVVMIIIGNTMNGVDGIMDMVLAYIAIMLGLLTVTAMYIMIWCAYHKK